MNHRHGHEALWRNIEADSLRGGMMLSDRLPHKTEAGAVSLGVRSPADVEAAIARIRAGVRRYDAGAVSNRFLIESPRYRITNGFAIGSLDRFIQMVFGRV